MVGKKLQERLERMSVIGQRRRGKPALMPQGIEVLPG
jgi:hypothetical protein